MMIILMFFRNLSLTNNTGYRLTIRGMNKAGLHTDIISAIIIPIRAPGLGTVSDGYDPLIDINYLTNTSEVQASWQGFETFDVKIRAYFFAVGSCTKGNYHVTNNQLIPVMPPTATSFGIQNLHLENGQKYCIKIKAENLAGVESSIVSSDGFIVDVSPPDIRHAKVLDGRGDDDIVYQTSKVQLFATWTGIQDYESGIQHFEVAVSRNRADQPDVTPFKDVGRNKSSTITGLYLNNEVYYIILCAINNAGLKSCLASDGVLIDPTPPSSGVVHDGILEPDIQYQASTNKLSANWERIWDKESRIERFEWGIGEDLGDLVQEFVDVGLQTHVTSNKVLDLKHGHNYIVFLRIYNRDGKLSELTSNGVIIDTTPSIPSEIILKLSLSEWIFSEEIKKEYLTSGEKLRVIWSEFEDQESRIDMYKTSVVYNNTEIVNYTIKSIGGQQEIMIDTGLLHSAKDYRIVVKCINYAGLESSAISTPFTIDNTPPFYTGNKDKLPKRHFLSDPHLLKISWDAFNDDESPVEFNEIGIGTLAYSDDIYTFTKVDQSTYFSFSNFRHYGQPAVLCNGEGVQPGGPSDFALVGRNYF